eukprot:2717730-Alexandrium_andersonii.AAC.1
MSRCAMGCGRREQASASERKQMARCASLRWHAVVQAILGQLAPANAAAMRLHAMGAGASTPHKRRWRQSTTIGCCAHLPSKHLT